MEKIGDLNKDMLVKVLFEINISPVQDMSGSPSSKFFGRGIRSSFPNSVDREVERRLLVAKRKEAQLKLSLKKGRTSLDQFAVGDAVRVRNHLGGRWDRKGVVVKERPTGTASPPSSFVIKFVDGHEGLRHKSYMKHELPDIGSQAVVSAGSMPPTANQAVLGTGSGTKGDDDPSCIPVPSGPTTRARAKRGGA